MNQNGSFPKCCPENQSVFSRNHPEICKFSNVSYPIESNFNLSFMWNPLNCIKVGKFFDQGVLLNRNLIQDIENGTEFCIDKLTTSEGLYFFKCGENWPYGEFSEEIDERWVFNIPAGLSVLFCTLLLLMYTVQLRSNKGNEIFYLKFYFILANELFFINIFVNALLPFNPHEVCKSFNITSQITANIIAFWAGNWNTIFNVDLLLSFLYLKSPKNYFGKVYFSRKMIIYSILGWISPLICIPTFYILTSILRPTNAGCIQEYFSEYYWAITYLFRLILFILIIFLIIKYFIETKISRENMTNECCAEFKKIVWLFIKLFFINGVLWAGVFLLHLKNKPVKSHPWLDDKSGVWEWIIWTYLMFILLQGVWYFLLFGFDQNTWIFLKIFKKGCRVGRHEKQNHESTEINLEDLK